MTSRSDHLRQGAADWPAIPGLELRLYAGEADLEPLHQIMDASLRHDDIDVVETFEEFVHDFEHPRGFDPGQDVLVAEVDGNVTAFNQVAWQHETAGDYIYKIYTYVAPEWRGNGIGRAMLQAAELRCREIAVSHAADATRFFQIISAASETQKHALLETEGYHVARYFFEMVRPHLDDLPDAPLPDGLEIRPALPEHDWAIWNAALEAFSEHWGHDRRTESDFKAWQAKPIHDRSLWRVAWDGDEVAGMVLNFIHQAENERFSRKRGYTEDISVRKPWRRRGLATALIVESLRTLKERGMEEAGLGVDAENRTGALGLYERLGYRVVKEWRAYRKRMELE